MKNFCLSLFFLLFSAPLFAQKTYQLIDHDTSKGVSFIEIYQPNGQLLTITDLDGNFEINDEQITKISIDDFAYHPIEFNLNNESTKLVLTKNNEVLNLDEVLLSNIDSTNFYASFYFRNYNISNQKMVQYTDGIIEIHFDKNKKKLNYVAYRNGNFEDVKTDAFILNDKIKYPNSVYEKLLKKDIVLKQNPAKENQYIFEKTFRKGKLVANGFVNLNDAKKVVELKYLSQTPEENPLKFLGFEFYVNQQYINEEFLERYASKVLKSFNNEIEFQILKEKKAIDLKLYNHQSIELIKIHSKPNENYVKFNKKQSNYQEKYWEDDLFKKFLSRYNQEIDQINFYP